MQRIDVGGDLIEFAWSGQSASQAAHSGLAPIVFLHHGFGCVGDWHSFPDKIVQATGLPALVYSRRGCGHSSPLPGPRDATYLHQEARCFLPMLLDALEIPRIHLYGHSDGASIALLFASGFPDRALSAVVEAPHVFAEPLTVAGVAALKQRFDANPNLFERFAGYHNDAKAAVEEWARPWLSADFAEWSIVGELHKLYLPLLVIQGAADPFGTMRHASIIHQHAPSSTILELPGCKHSPHVEAERVVVSAVAQFLRGAVQHSSHC